MADLVSAQLKTIARQQMKNIFDTWKRSTQIRAYKVTANEITLVDPNFNADWGNTPDNFDNFETTYTEETQYSDFDARVWYEDYRPIKYSFQGSDDTLIKANHDWGTIRIQLEQTGYDYIKDAERITFLGETFRFSDEVKKIGIFGDFQFYEYILEHVE